MMDELDRFDTLEKVIAAEELWNAIRPNIPSCGKMWIAMTPRGESKLFGLITESKRDSICQKGDE